MRNILEIAGLCKSYETSKGNQLSILKNINLQIKEGDFVSVMGPSGSGKSTLLYNVSGMDKITSGCVRFDEEDLSKLSEERLAQIRLTKMGFVFQQIHLLKNLCIFDNIILSARLAKKNDHKHIQETALKLMKQTGIENLADNDITQASGGQLQRVGICRALINGPSIIFGDEPTGALNSKATQEIMEILTDINKSGTTIFLATHDVKVAAKTERVLYMLDGEIIAEKYLGKNVNGIKDEKSREEKLSNWLSNKGF